jgi:hypothetical protein
MIEDEIIKEMSAIPHRCYICECLDNFEFMSMARLQHQITVDAHIKSELINRGFCNHHFWAIASLTSHKTAAAIGIMMFLENNNFPARGCLICECSTAKESELLNEFMKEVTEAAVNKVQQFEKSLCNSHFSLIMSRLDANVAEYLSGIQRDHTEKLVRELKSFEEKNRFDQSKEEKTSWWRAVENLVGRKGMTCRWEDLKL